VLCLLVSGCRSIEKASPERTAVATIARVSSTNAVPVEIQDDDHVVVRGALNGREVRLVLDTGASHVVVSPAAAAAAGIQKEAKVRFGGFGNGRENARKGVADSVVVGPAAAERVPVAIMPIPPVVGADGLLGLSFLRHFIFRLDYDQERVSFAAATNRLMGGGSMLALQQEAPPLVVQTEVDGIPARLVLDTGASQGLILRSWFVAKHKLRERYPKRLNTVTGLGLSGQMRGEIVRLRTLKLGDYTITNVFAEFETTADAWSGDSAGYVGAPVLRRFDLTFDVAGRRLWIEPNASYATEQPPPASVRSGFACLPEGTTWIVQDLIADSPAAEAGVRHGDRLLEINGAPVQSLKPQEIKRAFRAEPGTRVRLRLQTGRETPREATLILRDLL